MARKASFKTILARQKKFVEREVTLELIASGQEMKTDHDKVVRDWAHRPTFKAQTDLRAFLRTVKIVVKGQHADIWAYVDKGTKPHDIPLSPKIDGFLRFQLGYNARTAPKAQFAQGTGTASGAWVTAKQVHHPGTKARKFSETILKELSPPIEDRIQAAVKRGLDKGK